MQSRQRLWILLRYRIRHYKLLEFFVISFSFFHFYILSILYQVVQILLLSGGGDHCQLVADCTCCYPPGQNSYCCQNNLSMSQKFISRFYKNYVLLLGHDYFLTKFFSLDLHFHKRRSLRRLVQYRCSHFFHILPEHALPHLDYIQQQQ